MDKTCKRVLEHMHHDGKPEQYNMLFFDDYIKLEAELCGLTIEDFSNAVSHLINEGFVEHIRSRSGRITGIKLTHKGVHYKEFTRQKIREYIVDKWIDIIALVVAVAAFIQSCIALAS